MQKDLATTRCSDAEPASPTAPSVASQKRRLPLYVLACVYQNDVTAVFVSLKLGKVKAIRDEMRLRYGSLAAFHTINLNMPPKRWLGWEQQIRQELGLPPLTERAIIPADPDGIDTFKTYPSPDTGLDQSGGASMPQPEPVSPGSAPNTDGPEYRCVNGHDRCNQMYPGPNCPYCERVDAPRQIDPRDPDPTREPPFDYHNCARCRSGEKPCVEGNPRGCSWLHARND